MTEGAGPLAGLVVVDLSTTLPSAYTSLLFADCGAGGHPDRASRRESSPRAGGLAFLAAWEEEYRARLSRHCRPRGSPASGGGRRPRCRSVPSRCDRSARPRLHAARGREPGARLHLDHRIRTDWEVRQREVLRGHRDGQDRIDVRSQPLRPARTGRHEHRWRHDRRQSSRHPGLARGAPRTLPERPRAEGRRHHDPRDPRPGSVGLLRPSACSPVPRRIQRDRHGSLRDTPDADQLAHIRTAQRIQRRRPLDAVRPCHSTAVRGVYRRARPGLD